ncbi:MAG: hypothetical protein EBT03_11150 [Betaproteobacteria bacterium]|nr:hypothetical protein [Betaproteobacteria bacterium]NCA17290.1 hypothetical protein [Betaproteobacteria bacterium]
MDKLQQDRKDQEDEPLAEVDAEGCQVTGDECEFSAAERDGTAPESEFSLREEIFETFKPVTEIVVDSPFDGMPVPANERHDLAKAHPFTRETIVCVEDDTEYVELFTEELQARGWVEKRGLWGLGSARLFLSGDVKNTMPADAISQYSEDGSKRERRSFDSQNVVDRFGASVVLQDGKCIPVRMKRERCVHWRRQVMANDDQPEPTEPGHLIRYSNCAARRSVGGALMTMRDEAMYACDYRDPYDPLTAEKYLDKFDRERLNSKRHLELIRPFNLK